MKRQNRTWLCSVVYLDIVSFSKRTLTLQQGIKEHLAGLVAEALEHVPEEEVIVLDSGDGAAVCFMADPTEALFFALGLREALHRLDAKALDYSCRIGINLGPVKVIKDVTGRRNTIGDGINSAQRVMDFAAPNQLLVSRSFYELMSCLSDEYGKLFSHLGIRRDKHIKEYDIYEVQGQDDGGLIPSAPESGPCAPCGQGEAESFSINDWDCNLLDALNRELAQYIGPLAKLLVRRAGGEATSLADLYQRLATVIPEGEQRREFLSACDALSRTAQQGPTPEPAGPSLAAAVPPKQPVEPKAGLTLDPAIEEQLRRRLAEYVGPLAKVLVRRALAEADSYPILCRILARELPEGKKVAFIGDAEALRDA